VGVIGRDQASQRAAGVQDLLLTDDLLEGARTHADGERRSMVPVAVAQGPGRFPVPGHVEEVLLHGVLATSATSTVHGCLLSPSVRGRWSPAIRVPRR
jgi:hypothetical protein